MHAFVRANEQLSHAGIFRSANAADRYDDIRQPWRLRTGGDYPRRYVGPPSLKQRLRRRCPLKGSLSIESHSIAIQVNGIRIVADVEPRVPRTQVAQTEVDEDVDGSYTKEPNRA
jgi:hypothetical protein